MVEIPNQRAEKAANRRSTALDYRRTDFIYLEGSHRRWPWGKEQTRRADFQGLPSPGTTVSHAIVEEIKP